MLASLERFGVYDFGGGLGARYVPQDAAPSVDQYAERPDRARRTGTWATTSRS